jgi:hypothetical protein
VRRAVYHRQGAALQRPGNLSGDDFQQLQQANGNAKNVPVAAPPPIIQPRVIDGWFFRGRQSV